MYKEILKKIATEMKYNDWNCNDADVQRSIYTNGNINAFVEVLNLMGYEVESGSYSDDNGCDRFAHLSINGTDFVKNGEIQGAFYNAIR